jgi:hypothetical protein
LQTLRHANQKRKLDESWFALLPEVSETQGLTSSFVKNQPQNAVILSTALFLRTTVDAAKGE